MPIDEQVFTKMIGGITSTIDHLTRSVDGVGTAMHKLIELQEKHNDLLVQLLTVCQTQAATNKEK
jgi:hypothetical protein